MADEPWRIWGVRTAKAYDSEHGLMSEEDILRDDLTTFGWRVNAEGRWTHRLLPNLEPMTLRDAHTFAMADD